MGSHHHQVAALVPDEKLCVLIINAGNFSKQNKTSFIRDRCCHFVHSQEWHCRTAKTIFEVKRIAKVGNNDICKNVFLLLNINNKKNCDVSCKILTRIEESSSNPNFSNIVMLLSKSCCFYLKPQLLYQAKSVQRMFDHSCKWHKNQPRLKTFELSDRSYLALGIQNKIFA